MTQSEVSSNLSISSLSPAAPGLAHRSKTAVAWLACLLGVFGAHWWYLGRPRAWMVTAYSCLMIVLARFYPVWWDNPPFLLLLLPIADGYIEALIFALKPDDKFDQKYNPHSARVTRTRWAPVIAAIVTTVLMGVVLVFGIAMAVIYIYTSMGWLDGLKL
ncbi:TM2 domain-containing protein [Paralcaligenes sp. KSB-10]|jgi:hypothetical protein|uniref:NINE protein n=1 Tax=Paralcaligenes sp. KSB-10 TaxID=2901142 RepID=UPI001E419BCD|nr:NINE protein [Paralcaligenes sp. KSB-10]UHL62510.1 TM2 domain-containing protein [Paralcaligenes sp. KSB-10]